MSLVETLTIMILNQKESLYKKEWNILLFLITQNNKLLRNNYHSLKCITANYCPVVEDHKRLLKKMIFKELIEIKDGKITKGDQFNELSKEIDQNLRKDFKESFLLSFNYYISNKINDVMNDINTKKTFNRLGSRTDLLQPLY